MSESITPQHPAEALLLAKINPDVQDRLRKVRLMVFDVDGILTDGRLWYSEHGEALKAFHVLDGYGLRLLDENGIRVALITGREGAIVARRAAELGIAEVHQGVRNKIEVLQDMAQRLGLDFSDIGYMGDDIIDITAMQRVGFAATVPEAPSYIAHISHWISTKSGGMGAVRECCDLILASQHKLGAALLAQPLRTSGVIQ